MKRKALRYTPVNQPLRKIFAGPNAGCWFGLVSILLFGVFLLLPAIPEVLYRKGIFQVIRVLFDFTTGLLPFPAAAVWLPALVALALWFVFRKHRRFRLIPMRLLNAVGYTLAFFMLAWGFNYTCRGITAGRTAAKLKEDQLFALGTAAHERCVEMKAAAKMALLHTVVDEGAVREAVEQLLTSRGIPTAGRVRCRILNDDGTLRKLGIAGFFFPFHQEGYTSSTYLPGTVTFIVAHELSHGYGITHEGEADLVAYLALSQSGHPAMQYAGELELLRNVRGRLKRESPEKYAELKANTAPAVEDDLRAIYLNGLGYQEYVPGVQEKFNDLYLKSMGVSAGVGSYDHMLEMVYAERVGL